MYGIYSAPEQRIIEGGFTGEEEAETGIRERAADGEDAADLLVEELCDDHPGEPSFNCRLCLA